LTFVHALPRCWRDLRGPPATAAGAAQLLAESVAGAAEQCAAALGAAKLSGTELTAAGVAEARDEWKGGSAQVPDEKAAEVSAAELMVDK